MFNKKLDNLKMCDILVMANETNGKNPFDNKWEIWYNLDRIKGGNNGQNQNNTYRS